MDNVMVLFTLTFTNQIVLTSNFIIGNDTSNGASFFGYMGIAAALVFCSKYKGKYIAPNKIWLHICVFSLRKHSE